MPDKNNAVADKSAEASTPVSTPLSPPVVEGRSENAEPERILETESFQDVREEPSFPSVSDADVALRAIKSSSRHIIDLFVPVTVCMVIVVAMVNTMPSISRPKTNVATLMFGPKGLKDQDAGKILWQSLILALMILGFVIVMTIAIIILYKFRFYKILTGFLFLSSIILLFFFFFIYFEQLLSNYNVPFDYMTLAVLMWNYGIVGLVAIHFRSPMILQQAYLIVNSALVAVTFIMILPDWTIWLLLAIISIWDLIAVLCPMGPLRILVETAQQRQEPLFPSLVYSTRMIWFYGMTDEDETQAVGYGKPVSDEKTKQLDSYTPTDTSSPNQQKPERWKSPVNEGQASENRINTPNSNDVVRQLSSPAGTQEDKSVQGPGDPLSAENEGGNGQAGLPGDETNRNSPQRIVEHITRRESSGVKLGLGDFIFYSILVGKASAKSDWNTTMACFIAILVGLSTTLLLLFIFRKALPALPISIAFGLTFYFLTSLLVVDFIDTCQLNQIYI